MSGSHDVEIAGLPIPPIIHCRAIPMPPAARQAKRGTSAPARSRASRTRKCGDKTCKVVESATRCGRGRLQRPEIPRRNRTHAPRGRRRRREPTRRRADRQLGVQQSLTSEPKPNVPAYAALTRYLLRRWRSARYSAGERGVLLAAPADGIHRYPAVRFPIPMPAPSVSSRRLTGLSIGQARRRLACGCSCPVATRRR